MIFVFIFTSNDFWPWKIEERERERERKSKKIADVGARRSHRSKTIAQLRSFKPTLVEPSHRSSRSFHHFRTTREERDRERKKRDDHTSPTPTSAIFLLSLSLSLFYFPRPEIIWSENENGNHFPPFWLYFMVIRKCFSVWPNLK